MASFGGKRAYKRWDDVEERQLAGAVKAHGTKAWEKVQVHMGSERNLNQLQAHWLERQEQCKQLLETLGPAPRPNGRASVATAYNTRAEGENAGKGRGKDVKKANLLTRIPSLRYRFHPYQRDDHVQQAGEAAEVDRVREALGRCVPAVLAYFLSVAVSTRARCTYFPSEKHTLLSMSPFSAMPVAATVQLTIESAPHNPASACMFDFLLPDTLHTYTGWKTCSLQHVQIAVEAAVLGKRGGKIRGRQRAENWEGF